MFGWGQAQAQGQQPVQQRGRRVRQQPGRRRQIAPNVQWNPFDPANYANANGILVTVNARNMGLDIAGAQRRNAQNSDILRASLFESGVREPRVRNQAHHIVESSNQEGLRILRDYSINPNSDVNGVFLPTAQPTGIPDLTIHLGSHTQEYTDCVNEALTKAVNSVAGRDFVVKQQAIVNCLNTIRSILLTEVVPINSGVDANYNPATDSGITIREIFINWGLIDR